QFLHAEGLCHVVVRAEVEHADFFLLAAAHRKHDHRYQRRPTELLQRLGAIHVTEPEVEDDEIRRSPAREFDGLGRRLGLVDLVALRREAGAQEATDRRLVVDHQNARRAGHATGAGAPWAAIISGTGKVIVNRAPERSARFVAAMRPPMPSTKPREIERPSPVPAGRLSPSLARWNFSKIRSS